MGRRVQMGQSKWVSKEALFLCLVYLFCDFVR